METCDVGMLGISASEYIDPAMRISKYAFNVLQSCVTLNLRQSEM